MSATTIQGWSFFWPTSTSQGPSLKAEETAGSCLLPQYKGEYTPRAMFRKQRVGSRKREREKSESQWLQWSVPVAWTNTTQYKLCKTRNLFPDQPAQFCVFLFLVQLSQQNPWYNARSPTVTILIPPLYWQSQCILQRTRLNTDRMSYITGGILGTKLVQVVCVRHLSWCLQVYTNFGSLFIATLGQEERPIHRVRHSGLYYHSQPAGHRLGSLKLCWNTNISARFQPIWIKVCMQHL